MNNYTAVIVISTPPVLQELYRAMRIIVYKGNSLEQAVKAIENYRKWNNDHESTSEIITEK